MRFSRLTIILPSVLGACSGSASVDDSSRDHVATIESKLCPVQTPPRVGVFRKPNTQFNPNSSDMWLLRNTATQGNPDNSFNYGWAGAQPVLGRWTQDGPVGVATYSPPGAQFNNTTSSLWSLRNSASAGTPDSSFYYGTTGDVPLAGDWDGNLQTGIGVFRPSNQNWILRNAPSGGAADIPIFAYGAPGDIPVVGDWDMDGKATIGIARPPFSQFNSDSRYLWLLRNTNSNGSNDIPAFYFGFGGDIPVVGDWDQDGRTTIGVFRPAGTGTNTTTSGQWLLTNIFSSTPTINFYYGASGDVPAVGAVQYIPCL